MFAGRRLLLLLPLFLWSGKGVDLCVEQDRPAIVLYYTNYCPYSRQVLNYLKQNHKTLPMKNVADDPEAKGDLKRVGGRLEVPCLVIDGKAYYTADTVIDWLSGHLDELENAPK